MPFAVRSTLALAFAALVFTPLSADAQVRRDQQTRPPAASPQQPPTFTPDTKRAGVVSAVEVLLTTGRGDLVTFERLFELAPIGAQRPTLEARRAVAQAFTTATTGRTFDARQAELVGEGVAATAVSTGMKHQSAKEKREGMRNALAAAGASGAQIDAFLAAADRFVAEQQSPIAQRFVTELSALRAGAANSAEKLQGLTASIVAMFPEDLQPSAQSAATLAGQLVAAVSEARFTAIDSIYLATELERALGASQQAAAVEAIGQVRSVLLSAGAGVARADAAAAACRSLHALVHSARP